jgi:hypothetical protein
MRRRAVCSERLRRGANEERVNGAPMNLAIITANGMRRRAVCSERLRRGANEERVNGAHK